MELHGQQKVVVVNRAADSLGSATRSFASAHHVRADPLPAADELAKSLLLTSHHYSCQYPAGLCAGYHAAEHIGYPVLGDMTTRTLPRRLLASAQLRPLTPPARPAFSSSILRQRCQSTASSSAQTRATAAYRPDDDYMEHGFDKPLAYVVNLFGRFFKYTAVGLVLVGSTAFTAWEGTQMYIEYFALSAETDAEVKKWEWDKERENWTGPHGGGTDGGLGFKGAHAVRAAWAAQYWGIGGESTVQMNSNSFSGASGRAMGIGPMNVVEARLEYAADFITAALKAAEERKEKLLPQTMNTLLVRRASILELMGTRDALFEARLEFENVWRYASSTLSATERAKLALKLGDLNGRLGDTEDARSWWSQAIQLTNGQDIDLTKPPAVPESVPPTPLAQRTLVSTLVSLSVHYATTGQLRPTQLLQESALNLIRTIPVPASFNRSTAPQALHALYLLHRSALLSIHHAEVLYALRSPPPDSIAWLQNAAESSERVARVLTGLPAVHPDAPTSKIPHPPASEKPLIPAFTKSVSVHKPASSLLRDSRRSAAEAWNLIGILTESEGHKDSAAKALECYERALGWAGVAADRVGNIGQAGDGVLEAEWKVLWANYVRVKDASRKKD